MANAFEFSLAQGPGTRQSVQNGIRVLFAKEDGIGKEGKLYLVESISSLNVTGILWVLGHAKVIVEFEAHLSSSFQLFVVKPIYLSMRVDSIIDTLEVKCVEQWLIESDPDRDSICKVCQDLSVIDKSFNKRLVLIPSIRISDIGMSSYRN